MNSQALNLGSYNDPVNGATAKSRAHIVNMSFGGLDNGFTNNAREVDSQWVDWSALSVGTPGDNSTSVSPSDNLFVVAGNEGSAQAPSDAYNAINVGSTGIRNAAGNLVYNRVAAYNTSNNTADLSGITRLGRIKTDIVAPGGDPGPNVLPANTTGTFNAPPASGNINQFLTTSGQQWELVSGTGTNTTTNPAVFKIDDYNGGNPATGLTGGYYRATDNTVPFIVGPATSPNQPANLTGNDQLQARTLAGTSFAAPLVSGAAAVLEQYGTAQGFTIDHRVIKAILLNGASKSAPGGGPLLDINGNPWGAALNPMSPANNKLLPGQTFMKADPFNENGTGSVSIKIGIDPQIGTGQLDLVSSLVNYSARQQAPGNVRPVGWDLRNIAGFSAANPAASLNDYLFTNSLTGTLSATLTWDRILSINYVNNNANNSGIWVPGDTFNATNAAGTMDGSGGQRLTDLDLELFRVNNLGQKLGGPIDFSTSDIDNVEHIYSPGLAAGNYDLEVLNRMANQSDVYALAWSVPEPTTLALLILGTPIVFLALRRRKAAHGGSRANGSSV